MHDAQHQDHAVFVDRVVHDAIVADAEPMEGIARSLDRLDRLAASPTRLGGVTSELLERFLDPRPQLRRQLLERPDGRRRQLDAVRGQTSSFRVVVQPSA
jgi:hypothetical protein